MTPDQLAEIASSRYFAWTMQLAWNPAVVLDCSEIDDQVFLLALDHGVKVFRSLPKPQRRAANAMFRSIARSITEENMTRVRADLLKAIRVAAVLPEAKRLQYIRRALTRIGIYGDDKSVVQTVTRTQASIADSAANWIKTFADPNVWGYEYVAKEDARPSHRALHGVRYPKRHKFWRYYFAPNGWNCRCRCRPITYRSMLARTKPFTGTPDVDPGFRFNAGQLIAGRVY